MLVKYRHISETEKEKIYDTVKALKNNPFIQSTQKEFDDFELKHFEKDKRDGIIIDYQIIEG